jgi:molecular chaperone DnaK (HSP70)
MKIGINMVTGSIKPEEAETPKETNNKQNLTLEEATTEANHLINTTYKFIDEHKELLNAEEVKTTEQIMQQLFNGIVARDRDQIIQFTEGLDERARQLAQLVAEH